MSNEKFLKKLRERNATICAGFVAGATLAELENEHHIGTQRIRQILHAGGVWKRGPVRSVFLGVDITPDAKEKLKLVAEEQEKSVSRLVSDAIDNLLEGTEGDEDHEPKPKERR